MTMLNHERLMQMFDQAQRHSNLKRWRAVADEFIRAQDLALRDARDGLREAMNRAEVDQAQIAQLRTALFESVKLQSHYAQLLNAHDGGTRMFFGTAEAWLKRLKETGTL